MLHVGMLLSYSVLFCSKVVIFELKFPSHVKAMKIDFNSATETN